MFELASLSPLRTIPMCGGPPAGYGGLRVSADSSAVAIVQPAGGGVAFMALSSGRECALYAGPARDVEECAGGWLVLRPCAAGVEFVPWPGQEAGLETVRVPSE